MSDENEALTPEEMKSEAARLLKRAGFDQKTAERVVTDKLSKRMTLRPHLGLAYLLGRLWLRWIEKNPLPCDELRTLFEESAKLTLAALDAGQLPDSGAIEREARRMIADCIKSYLPALESSFRGARPPDYDEWVRKAPSGSKMEDLDKLWDDYHSSEACERRERVHAAAVGLKLALECAAPPVRSRLLRWTVGLFSRARPGRPEPFGDPEGVAVKVWVACFLMGCLLVFAASWPWGRSLQYILALDPGRGSLVFLGLLSLPVAAGVGAYRLLTLWRDTVMGKDLLGLAKGSCGEERKYERELPHR